MMDWLLLFAEGEAAKPAAAPPGLQPMDMFMIMAVVMLFIMMVLRPGRRSQERERDKLLNSLKKNDKVLTTAGIYGTIVSVSDKEDEVVVKVDDNARLKMLKSCIHRNLTAEETIKAEAEKAKEAKNTK